ncbi:FadR/GntR family transcriptional regulator [Tenggerimyces flavus]|uniref:FadR/GntR family transcriptional regulator n=1 Tax=Tenggerimyces flavus TaxID=1708749 RepID=A0ABV7YE48_9ACTN|nr:FCD domain-containing protein [Tenggerimyces flavus]MBM7787130.1 DNA-binding FadR family transcriptional regulator [Tenggerimyces flavus]
MASSGRQLEGRIIDLIFEHGLSTGAAMPPEPQLVATLGASRNSVREALRALHTLGIVEIRHGYGTFVGQAPLTAVAPGLLFRTRLSVRDDPAALADLVQTRELLELGLLDDVVKAVDDALLTDLETAAAAMRTGSVSTLADADRRFHQTLYRSAGNELAAQLIDLFWDIYHQVEAELEPPYVDRERIAADHLRIVDALRSGDVDTVRAAVREHFKDLGARVEHVRR